MLDLIMPFWPAPDWVHACTTTRRGGYSLPPYAEFNLADHVGDDPVRVAANRQKLKTTLKLTVEPQWLQQVHGTEVILANSHCTAPNTADAVYTTQPQQVCVVLTADCLPALFCNRTGTCVAAVHAGWRGLAAGILEATLQRFTDSPQDILVWLGPAIGPTAFEVGAEVRTAFIAHLPQAEMAFVATRPGHWLADLYLLAKQRLAHQGVTAVYGGDFCTYTEPQRFYSYRRERDTGRMASLIWFDDNRFEPSL